MGRFFYFRWITRTTTFVEKIVSLTFRCYFESLNQVFSADQKLFRLRHSQLTQLRKLITSVLSPKVNKSNLIVFLIFWSFLTFSIFVCFSGIRWCRNSGPLRFSDFVWTEEKKNVSQIPKQNSTIIFWTKLSQYYFLLYNEPKWLLQDS